jgi:hypothetical protein
MESDWQQRFHQMEIELQELREAMTKQQETLSPPSPPVELVSPVEEHIQVRPNHNNFENSSSTPVNSNPYGYDFPADQSLGIGYQPHIDHSMTLYSPPLPSSSLLGASQQSQFFHSMDPANLSPDQSIDLLTLAHSQDPKLMPAYYAQDSSQHAHFDTNNNQAAQRSVQSNHTLPMTLAGLSTQHTLQYRYTPPFVNTQQRASAANNAQRMSLNNKTIPGYTQSSGNNLNVPTQNKPDSGSVRPPPLPQLQVDNNHPLRNALRSDLMRNGGKQGNMLNTASPYATIKVKQFSASGKTPPSIVPTYRAETPRPISPNRYMQTTNASKRKEKSSSGQDGRGNSSWR